MKTHPWAEKQARYPDDICLRAHGFRIRARERNGLVLWERGGTVYTQEQAVELVKHLDVEKWA